MTAANLFINDSWVAGEGAAFESINPARNEVVWQGKAATDKQVDAAVLAARQAFPDWADRSVDERLSIIKRFAELLEQNKTEFAQIIAEETGKPLWETATEVGSMIAKVAISERAYNERT